MNRTPMLALAAALTAPFVASPSTAPAETPSWVFLPSTYTHDPQTGARVAQYAPIAPVEPLPDPRLVTSGFRRTRTSFRGPNGTLDTSFQVQNFSNGRGGIDAEWERVAEEWRSSFLSGSFFNQTPGFVPAGFGPQGFVQPGFGQQGFGPSGFVPSGFTQPGFAQPGFVQPGFAPQGAFFPRGFAPQGNVIPPAAPRPNRGSGTR